MDLSSGLNNKLPNDSYLLYRRWPENLILSYLYALKMHSFHSSILICIQSQCKQRPQKVLSTAPLVIFACYITKFYLHQPILLIYKCNEASTLHACINVIICKHLCIYCGNLEVGEGKYNFIIGKRHGLTMFRTRSLAAGSYLLVFAFQCMALPLPRCVQILP